MPQLLAVIVVQLLTVATTSFQGRCQHRRATRAAAITLGLDASRPNAGPLEMAQKQSLRKVAMYRDSVEDEVKALRDQLETVEEETERRAISIGRPLPDDWARPMQMATKRTLRQVEMYGASMEAEMASLREQLESVQAELDELRAAAGKTE